MPVLNINEGEEGDLTKHMVSKIHTNIPNMIDFTKVINLAA